MIIGELVLIVFLVFSLIYGSIVILNFNRILDMDNDIIAIILGVSGWVLFLISLAIITTITIKSIDWTPLIEWWNAEV